MKAKLNYFIRTKGWKCNLTNLDQMWRSVCPHWMSKTRVVFRYKRLQLPVNLNDANTGHELQGLSKDVTIIMSWPKGGMTTWSKNREYAVLSQVRSLAGLYLLEPIELEKSFTPSEELERHLRIVQTKEKQLFRKITNTKQKLAAKYLSRKLWMLH